MKKKLNEFDLSLPHLNLLNSKTVLYFRNIMQMIKFR